MTTEGPTETEGAIPPLTRADVERLRSQVESSAGLDLSFQNLEDVDLSYLDLRILHHHKPFGDRLKQTYRGKTAQQSLASPQPRLIDERLSSSEG
jgi:hypothetical protein